MWVGVLAPSLIGCVMQATVSSSLFNAFLSERVAVRIK